MVKETPPKDSIENFWKGIWDMSASWIGHMEKGNEKVKEQEWQNITVLELNPIQDGLFRGCSRWGGGLFGPPSLKSATHILQ